MDLQVLLEYIRRAPSPLSAEDISFVRARAELLSPEDQAEVNRVLALQAANQPSEEPVVEGKEEDDPADPEDDQLTQPPQLVSHQIDVPEEPERIRVVTQIWNPAEARFVETDLGEMLLIPTGCEEPEFLSPYENSVSFRSPLPRDKANEANLFGSYQQNGWVSRDWVRKNLDEEIDPIEVEKQIADDIPVILALQGKPDPGTGAGVAQTDGGKAGNNGAPLPPGPGPGRGNKVVPGDNAASGVTPGSST